MELTYDPPLPPTLSGDDTFVQTIRLHDGPTLIGQARWHCATPPAQGVVQILELSVAEPHRRQNHAHTLMDAVTKQAKSYFKQHGRKLRRLWLTLEQERQVLGRSFLMKFGFHHVGTVHEMLKDEDMLVYMRTFD